MNFEFTYFLYFLPISLLPLFILLKRRFVKKKLEFPSVEIFEEILRSQSKMIKWHFFLKQLLRFLTLFFLILAFASPVVLKEKQSYVLIIDPTLSMKDFNLYPTIEKIKSAFIIEKIYCGEEMYNGEIYYEGGEKEITEIIKKVVEKEKTSSIFLLTDAQKSNFKDFRVIISNLCVLILKHRKDNVYFEKLEVFPEIITRNSKLYLSGQLNTRKSTKLKIFLNEKLFSEEIMANQFSKEILLDDSMLREGVNRLKLIIEGEDYPFDNEVERVFFYLPTPRVYIESQSSVFRNYITEILKVLFGKFKEVSDTKIADIVFASRIKFPENDRLSFYFPDEGIKLFSEIPFLVIENELQGKLESDIFPSMNALLSLKLITSFRIMDGSLNFIPVVKMENENIIYKYRNSFIFTFSIIKNIEELFYHPVLLFFVYDTLKSFLLDKEKGKLEEFPYTESQFEFYTKEDFTRLIKRRGIVKNLNVMDEKDIIESRKLRLSPWLFLLALLLFLLDLFYII